eukprot:1193879-Pleurochrysis_carterae.AAC.1
MRLDIAREGEQVEVKGPMLTQVREGRGRQQHGAALGDAAGVLRVAHTGHTSPETDRGCMRQPWDSPHQRHGVCGAA